MTVKQLGNRTYWVVSAILFVVFLVVTTFWPDLLIYFVAGFAIFAAASIFEHSIILQYINKGYKVDDKV